MAEYEYRCRHCSWWDDVPPLVAPRFPFPCPACGGPVEQRLLLDPAERKDYEDNRDD